MDLLSIATYEASDYVYTKQWLEENCKPDYTDNVLKENLYSVNVLDTYQKIVPEFVERFIQEVLETSPNTAYFRFIDL